MSHARPAKCTTIIALVREVSTGRMVSAVMHLTCGVHIRNNRCRSSHHHRARRRNKSAARHHHFIAGSNSQGMKRKLERDRAVGDRNAMLQPANAANSFSNSRPSSPVL